MNSFLVKHKAKLLIGVGVLGAGSIATAGFFALNGSSEIDEDGNGEETGLTLTSAKRTDWFNTPDTQIQGYKKLYTNKPLQTNDLVQEDKKSSYQSSTIAHKLISENRVQLVSENASADTWAAVSLKVLDDHYNSQNDDMSGYYSGFRGIVLDIKRNWDKYESLKGSWGRDLKAMCSASYRNDASKEDMLRSVEKLCVNPSSEPNK